MSKELKIIGINLGDYDGGCALLIGDRIQYAIAEERLNRFKYSSGWISSLLYCLKAANLSLDDIDLFVFSVCGKPLPLGYAGDLKFLGIDTNKCLAADHHLSHAISAFAMSPFDDALVIVMDGIGNNNDTESYYVVERKHITRIGGNNPTRRHWKGIGTTYEAFTNFLGFSDLEAGKIMALAAYGDPQQFNSPLFDINHDQVIGNLDAPHQQGVIELSRKMGFCFGDLFPSATSEISWHIAAYIQRQTELVIMQLVDNLIQFTHQENICLSGGVALNCLVNTRVRNETRSTRLFALPFASDTGQPIGNALYGYYHLTGEIPKQSIRGCSFGKTYTEDEIEAGLKRKPGTERFERLLRYNYVYERQSNIASVAAKLLADGRILGWYQSGSELGPRALGYRSILANPRPVEMRDYLNQRIKHREWFRPFAPSILEEKINQFTDDVSLSRFMLEAPLIRTDAQSSIQSAMHVDGTARVQVVSRDENSLYHRLIMEFERHRGYRQF